MAQPSTDRTTSPSSHFRFGWITLAIFALGGLTLEAMHGFKVGLYLDVGNETRRLMWTLAHAHGTLFGLLHLAWGATIANVETHAGRVGLATKLLRAATVLLPGGFFLGGFWTFGSDPGLGAVLLAPLGGLVMISAMVIAARSIK